MYAVALRGGWWWGALILTVLCACAGYAASSTWRATLTPNVAVRVIDETAVAVTIDAGASIDLSNGWAVLTGTVKCSRDETFDLAVTLEQEQRDGRGVTDVRAATLLPVDCTTSLRPWSATMTVTNGAFQIGSARAIAQTTDAPAWVAPTSATKTVKLFAGRMARFPLRPRLFGRAPTSTSYRR
jgi:hypothetical protein